jgi:hypothetical protein
VEALRGWTDVPNGCPGFTDSRNAVRELSTEEANRLRALLDLAPIAEFQDNPKYSNVDVALQKRFPIARHPLRVSLEVFNVFNIPQRSTAWPFRRRRTQGFSTRASDSTRQSNTRAHSS